MPSSAQPPTEALADLSAGQLPPLVVICGVTATGKTPLSLALAERLPRAQIVSADSRQVYRGMDIGTAKVSKPDRMRVPHHGLDLVEPDEPFTVADFQAHAMAALATIAAAGGVALLVGGTGLYLRAVARGLPLAETGRNERLRTELEQRLAGEGLHALVTELRASAPGVAAATDLANPRRVVRALERASVVGDRPPPQPRGYPGQVVWIGLQPDATEHQRQITRRAELQFATGLLDEAAALRRRFDPSLPAFSAVGYREAFGVLDGSLTRDEALARAITRTRRLARRQQTWFRAEPGVTWLPSGADILERAIHLARRLVGGR